MSVDMDKANLNLDRFVTNLHKTILLIKTSISSLYDEDSESEFNDKLSETALVLEIASSFIEELSKSDNLKKDKDGVTVIEKKINFVRGFIEKSIPLWKDLKNKNIKVLKRSINSVVGGITEIEEYVEVIHHVLGDNDTGDILIDEASIESLWKCLNAITHGAIKYAIASKDQVLYDKLVEKKAVEFWGVNLNK